MIDLSMAGAFWLTINNIQNIMCLLSSDALHMILRKPRQRRNPATVFRWLWCRSLSGLFFLSFFKIMACFFHKLMTEYWENYYNNALFNVIIDCKITTKIYKIAIFCKKSYEEFELFHCNRFFFHINWNHNEIRRYTPKNF